MSPSKKEEEWKQDGRCQRGYSSYKELMNTKPPDILFPSDKSLYACFNEIGDYLWQQAPEADKKAKSRHAYIHRVLNVWRYKYERERENDALKAQEMAHASEKSALETAFQQQLDQQRQMEHSLQVQAEENMHLRWGRNNMNRGYAAAMKISNDPQWESLDSWKRALWIQAKCSLTAASAPGSEENPWPLSIYDYHACYIKEWLPRMEREMEQERLQEQHEEEMIEARADERLKAAELAEFFGRELRRSASALLQRPRLQNSGDSLDTLIMPSSRAPVNLVPAMLTGSGSSSSAGDCRKVLLTPRKLATQQTLDSSTPTPPTLRQQRAASPSGSKRTRLA